MALQHEAQPDGQSHKFPFIASSVQWALQETLIFQWPLGWSTVGENELETLLWWSPHGQHGSNVGFLLKITAELSVFYLFIYLSVYLQLIETFFTFLTPFWHTDMTNLYGRTMNHQLLCVNWGVKWLYAQKPRNQNSFVCLFVCFLKKALYPKGCLFPGRDQNAQENVLFAKHMYLCGQGQIKVQKTRAGYCMYALSITVRNRMALHKVHTSTKTYQLIGTSRQDPCITHREINVNVPKRHIS